ncbi:MAG TPA: iron-containing alcohol dehydrogenase [Acidimicrobiales bacterium]|jgi:alcohol dehydrogenase class IV|nr:iron-containing alcohol dehydrogenase [Acidimicrobiales bacterium]
MPTWPYDPAVFHTDAGLRAVITGIGCVRDHLAAELHAQGVARPLLLCGANVASSPAFAVVRAVAADNAAVFTANAPHSPSDAIDAAARLAREHGADGIVAVGGSSAIDSAKGVAVLLATGCHHVAALTPPGPGAIGHVVTRREPGVPVLTVTTTLSFAEFNPFWGTRRSDTGAKAGYTDYGRVVRTIFLDGAVAACTPEQVWNETAIKSLDDAFFELCLRTAAEPFLDPLLIAGIRGVIEHLPDCAGTDAAEARQRVLLAMAATKLPLPRLSAARHRSWFARGVRYALGSVFDRSHGVGACIAIAEGLRFHLGESRSRQDLITRELAWGDDPVVLADRIAALVRDLRLPTTFADAGIDGDDLARVVAYLGAMQPPIGPIDAVRAACDRLRQ